MTGSQAVEVRAVGAGATLDQFIRVPRALYADDPQWVERLRFERKQAFAENSPFFGHADWQAWVLFVDGTPVGRISAQIDNLYEPQHGEAVGYFGCIEAPDEQALFDLLLATARDWLSARGRTRMVGPYNLGVNQEVGLLVEGFDTSPYFMMPHSLPYYGARLEAAGMEGVQDMLAYLMSPQFETPRVMSMLKRRYLRGVTVRPIDRGNLDAELGTMREIFNDAWSQNWGFVPFTEQEFQAIGRELLLITPTEFLQIAHLDGRPVAFIVLLPNLNEVIKDLKGSLLPFGWAKVLWRLKVRFPTTGRVPLMGVRREFHHTKLGPGLAFAVIEALREPSIRRGVDLVELSWILEDNHGMRNIIEQIGGYVSKRYRMYSVDLSAAAAAARDETTVEGLSAGS